MAFVPTLTRRQQLAASPDLCSNIRRPLATLLLVWVCFVSCNSMETSRRVSKQAVARRTEIGSNLESQPKGCGAQSD